MTKTKAIEILKQHGFELTYPPTTLTYHADILHPVTDSVILGRIYEDSMYIKRILKEDSAYLWFNFREGASSTSFVSAVEKLESELKHYEERIRRKRVESIRMYFKERDLKRLRRDELLSSLNRGEHLSREEQRELSAMGYTI